MSAPRVAEPLPDVLTVEQAAEYLQISRVTVWRWLSDGRLPGAKMGGRWRILRSEIVRVLSGEPDIVAASAEALSDVWDNEDDAVYDNWRELYGVSEG